MQFCLKILLVIIFCTPVLSCKNRKETSFDSLGRIVGVWSMPDEDPSSAGIIIESWVKSNDSVYTGKSYYVKEGDSILSETIQLIESNGNVYYIPTVLSQNNQQPVSFLLENWEGNKFTFENMNHDFPTTIIYEFLDDSTLKAAISGIINGKLREIDFEYRKNLAGSR